MSEISKDYHGDAPFDKLDVAEITVEQVKAIEQKLFRGNELKPNSLIRLKHGWNSFCTFVGMIEWKFTLQINMGRIYKNEVISNADVLMMLDYCQKQYETSNTDAMRIRWLRIEIAIRLGWSQGFRSCEYVNATFAEVMQTGRISIRNSKHGGYREVAVTQETKAAILKLKDLLIECNQYPPEGGVFEKPNGMNYTTSTFRRWIGNAARGSGANVNKAKTHGLRHRFATNFHAYNHDEFMLADIMGHKSPVTTRNYVTPSFEKVRDAIQEANNAAQTA